MCTRTSPPRVPQDSRLLNAVHPQTPRCPVSGMPSSPLPLLALYSCCMHSLSLYSTIPLFLPCSSPPLSFLFCFPFPSSYFLPSYCFSDLTDVIKASMVHVADKKHNHDLFNESFMMHTSTSPQYPITLHYITLHYITLHYITLHYITLHYIILDYIRLY